MALDDLLTPRLVELGKIKIGTLGQERRSQSGGTYRMPQKLDHFTITTMNRDAGGLLEEDAALMQQLAAEHGSPDGHLREIPVALLSDDDDDNLQCAFVAYNGKTCGARSDGRTLTTFVDFKTGRKLAEPKSLPWDASYLALKNNKGGPLFKKHTVLNCVISAQHARWGGVYKFRTTSAITGDQLLGSLRHIKALTGGVVSGLPLRLVVRPMQVSPNGTTTTVYVVHLELRGPDLQAIQQKALELAQFRLQNRQQVLEAQRGLKRLIVMPGEEREIEAEDVRQEFHPDDNGESFPAAAEDDQSTLLDDPIEAEFTTSDSDPSPDLESPPVEREPGDDADADVDFTGPQQAASDHDVREGETVPNWHKRIAGEINATDDPVTLAAIKAAIMRQKDAGSVAPARIAALLSLVEQQEALCPQ